MGARAAVVSTTADRDERRLDPRGELFRARAGGEVEDPRRELGIGSFDSIAVDLEECQHRDEREALVAINEGLAFGDAVREDRCLQGEIGVLVVRVRGRSGERSFQPGPGCAGYLRAAQESGR